jgi:predicted flap endonuclease-1-like 5' DNA nuclease
MAWLIAQMWLWLLIAAAFGGMIGWALHVMRVARGEGGLLVGGAPLGVSAGVSDDGARIAELEAQLQQERDELEVTRSKATADLAMTADAGDGEGSVAWRNRYLESRVRFLEGKLTDLEAAAAPEQPKEDTNDEGTRLRWRNRYLEGRVKYLEEELVRGDHIVVTLPTPAPVYPSAAAGGVATLERPMASTGTKPAMLATPRDGHGDNLKDIAGIGPKLEKMLQSLGVYHFDQIASWTPAEIDWVNSAISFRGRIERERWVEQAQRLAPHT